MRRVGEDLIESTRAVAIAVTLLAAVSSPVVAGMAACPGDCDLDRHASVSELLRGMSIALGRQPVASCPSSDLDASATVTVDELVEIVHAVLYGCFATPRPSRTPTPTRGPNRAPVFERLPVYRFYPHEEMRVLLPASDPDGDALRYTGEGLPAGANLDEHAGEFHWIPGAGQVGLFSIPVTATDTGQPPLDARDVLHVVVRPLDGCTMPDCHPAVGCSSTLPDVDEHCCLSDPLPRVFEPVVECAGKPTIFLGRNSSGFGRLQNCDQFRVRNFSQGGAAVVFNLEVRCLNTSSPVLVRSVMDSATRFLFEDEESLELDERDDGFAEYRFFRIPVSGRGPFSDLEGQEANLSVTVIDVDGQTAQETVRLRLTFDRIPDLPEADSPLGGG